MSDLIRMSGMYSGLDTESIISQLVQTKQTKVDTLKGDQTKLEWKQNIWKDLNKQYKTLVNGTLGNLRYQSSYTKKTTTTSNDNKVSVTTADSAMNTVQSLKINKMATSGYLTGGKIATTEGKDVTLGTKLSEGLGIEAGSEISIKVGKGAAKSIKITGDMTMYSFVEELKKSGVEANFDASNQRLFIGSSKSGLDGNFTITASDSNGQNAMKKLGLATYDNASKTTLSNIAKMATDASAKAAAVSSEASKIYEKYKSQKEKKEEEKTSLQTKMDEQVASYKDKYATKDDDGNIITEGLDLSDATARSSKKASLEADITSIEDNIKALTKTTDAEGNEIDKELSDSEKELLATYEADLAKTKEELSGITSYEDNITALESADTEITNLQSKLDDYDNDPDNSSIQAEALAIVEAEISKAQAELNTWDDDKSNAATKLDGADAEIELNGAKFYSSTNTITVNGLTLNLKGTTDAGESITLTTKQDTSGIYDMIKKFIKEYSELANKIDKLYNADSASKYKMLTDDEKDEMSDSEVEKWETTIKDSLLRRDSTLNTVSSAMRTIMTSGFTVNGKTMYLSNFGINTLNYFNAADNEKNAFHINGDEDDEAVKSETNTLKSMIESNPDTVISFFTQLSKSLYDSMNGLMASSNSSSYGSVYDDKKMKTDYDEYTTKISDAEEKLNDYEDKWYSKFSKMETALAKMQSNASAVTGMLGTNY